MATSEVGICNMALSRIGIDQTIENLNDSNLRARACKLWYAQARDELLRDFAWNWAQKCVALAKLATETAPGWDHVYAYPTDCLKANAIGTEDGIRQINMSTLQTWYVPQWILPRTPFKIQLASDNNSRVIVTDQEEAYLFYTAKVTTVPVFDPMFKSMLAWRIATEIGLTLKADAALVRNAAQAYMTTRSSAMAAIMREEQTDAEADSPSVAVR